MSETVIISKTSPRQRSQPREPTTTTTTTATAATEPGRLEKIGSKSKGTAAASLVMVKELVHRDSSRLVKDLMALLAIREATKEAQSNDGGEQQAREEALLHKNRPGGGDTTVVTIPTYHHPDPDQAEHGGTRKGPATATTAAVASLLLHHTATQEFASLAGEIIAIADDTPTTVTSNDEGSSSGNDDDGDDELMLHADAAAAPELHTNEKSTDEREGLPAKRKDRPPVRNAEAEAREGLVGGRRYDAKCQDEEKQRAKTERASEMLVGGGDGGGNPSQRPTASCALLSGPVPASHPTVVCSLERSGTPIPTFAPPPPPVAAVTHVDTTDRPVALTLEQKLDKLLDSVVKIKADMHRRIDRLGKRVEQIHLDVQLNIDSTDRALLRNDLLLIGIPHREREDLRQCFRAVCRALEYTEQDIPQVDIRRQRIPGGGANRRAVLPRAGPKLTDDPTNGGAAGGEPIAPAPIVVEFMFKTLRDQFYRAYQAKRVLRLSDIGFASDRRFFVNEVLTKYNQKLMAEAVRRKRLGLLHSVYTVDGLVYVQRVAGEKGTKVTSFSSLN
uniref:Uncharacterized protein n=1 Tax=Anopheles stephensi TaxID=30069 RepID=A0A182Y2U8_ANOST